MTRFGEFRHLLAHVKPCQSMVKGGPYRAPRRDSILSQQLTRRKIVSWKSSPRLAKGRRALSADALFRCANSGTRFLILLFACRSSAVRFVLSPLACRLPCRI